MACGTWMLWSFHVVVTGVVLTRTPGSDTRTVDPTGAVLTRSPGPDTRAVDPTGAVLTRSPGSDTRAVDTTGAVLTRSPGSDTRTVDPTEEPSGVTPGDAAPAVVARELNSPRENPRTNTFQSPFLNMVASRYEIAQALVQPQLPDELLSIIDDHLGDPAYPHAVSFFFHLPTAEFTGAGYMQVTQIPRPRPQAGHRRDVATAADSQSRSVNVAAAVPFTRDWTVGQLRDAVIRQILIDPAGADPTPSIFNHVECCEGIDSGGVMRTVELGGDDAVSYSASSVEVYKLSTRSARGLPETAGPAQVPRDFDSYTQYGELLAPGSMIPEPDALHLDELNGDLAIVVNLRFCATDEAARARFGWPLCRGGAVPAVAAGAGLWGF